MRTLSIRTLSIRTLSIGTLSTRTRALKTFYLILALVAISGCDPQSRGFNLPPGNAEQGKATFLLMQCNNCHSVKGSVAWDGKGLKPELNIELGGTTTRVRTYGDLVTSIINPSHKLSHGDTGVTEDGESKMRNYNDVMSVNELIDLVEFLQSEYELWVPDYYTYSR